MVVMKRQISRGPRWLELGSFLLIIFLVKVSANENDLATLDCYYNYNHYSEGDRILTNEPCLNCTCHNKMLMCYLKVCPFTKPIGQDCTIEKREDQCCPIITCPEVPVELDQSVSLPNTSLANYKYGCTLENKFYPEGAQLPGNPKKPCELCYCIRNMTSCVMQECTLHVDGCRPIYNKGVCCPVRYDCAHDDETLLLEGQTTTEAPSEGFILTTTTMPPVRTTDCYHNGTRYIDGEIVKTEEPCEHCYCMRGDIVCAVQECGPPLEMHGNNCTARLPKEGECCPQVYDCSPRDGETTTIAESLSETQTEQAAEKETEKPEEEFTTVRHIVASTLGESTEKAEEGITEPGAITTERPDESENEIHDKEDEHLMTVKPTKNYTAEKGATESVDSRINWDSTTPSQIAGAITTISSDGIEVESPEKVTEGILGTLLTTVKSIIGMTTLSPSEETEVSITTVKPGSLDENSILANVIPGEGDCLVEGVSYANSSSIPPRTKCELSCICSNSIVQCESVKCGPVPANIENCNIYHNPDECCLTYHCDDRVQTTTDYISVKEEGVLDSATKLIQPVELTTIAGLEAEKIGETTSHSIAAEVTPSGTQPSQEEKSTEPSVQGEHVTSKQPDSEQQATDKPESTTLNIQVPSESVKDQGKESSFGYTEKMLDAVTESHISGTTILPSSSVDNRYSPAGELTEEPSAATTQLPSILGEQFTTQQPSVEPVTNTAESVTEKGGDLSTEKQIPSQEEQSTGGVDGKQPASQEQSTVAATERASTGQVQITETATTELPFVPEQTEKVTGLQESKTEAAKKVEEVPESTESQFDAEKKTELLDTKTEAAKKVDEIPESTETQFEVEKKTELPETKTEAAKKVEEEPGSTESHFETEKKTEVPESGTAAATIETITEKQSEVKGVMADQITEKQPPIEDEQTTVAVTEKISLEGTTIAGAEKQPSDVIFSEGDEQKTTQQPSVEIEKESSTQLPTERPLVPTEKLPEPTEERIPSASERFPVTHGGATEPFTEIRSEYTTPSVFEVKTSHPGESGISNEIEQAEVSESTTDNKPELATEKETESPQLVPEAATSRTPSTEVQTEKATEIPQSVTEAAKKEEGAPASTESVSDVEKKVEIPSATTEAELPKYSEKVTEAPELTNKPEKITEQPQAPTEAIVVTEPLVLDHVSSSTPIATESATETQTVQLDERFNTEQAPAQTESKTGASTEQPEEVTEPKVKVVTVSPTQEGSSTGIKQEPSSSEKPAEATSSQQHIQGSTEKGPELEPEIQTPEAITMKRDESITESYDQKVHPTEGLLAGGTEVPTITPITVKPEQEAGKPTLGPKTDLGGQTTDESIETSSIGQSFDVSTKSSTEQPLQVTETSESGDNRGEEITTEKRIEIEVPTSKLPSIQDQTEKATEALEITTEAKKEGEEGVQQKTEPSIEAEKKTTRPETITEKSANLEPEIQTQEAITIKPDEAITESHTQKLYPTEEVPKQPTLIEITTGPIIQEPAYPTSSYPSEITLSPESEGTTSQPKGEGDVQISETTTISFVESQKTSEPSIEKKPDENVPSITTSKADEETATTLAFDAKISVSTEKAIDFETTTQTREEEQQTETNEVIPADEKGTEKPVFGTTLKSSITEEVGATEQIIGLGTERIYEYVTKPSIQEDVTTEKHEFSEKTTIGLIELTTLAQPSHHSTESKTEIAGQAETTIAPTQEKEIISSTKAPVDGFRVEPEEQTEAAPTVYGTEKGTDLDNRLGDEITTATREEATTVQEDISENEIERETPSALDVKPHIELTTIVDQIRGEAQTTPSGLQIVTEKTEISESAENCTGAAEDVWTTERTNLPPAAGVTEQPVGVTERISQPFEELTGIPSETPFQVTTIAHDEIKTELNETEKPYSTESSLMSSSAQGLDSGTTSGAISDTEQPITQRYDSFGIEHETSTHSIEENKTITKPSIVDTTTIRNIAELITTLREMSESITTLKPMKEVSVESVTSEIYDQTTVSQKAEEPAIPNTTIQSFEGLAIVTTQAPLLSLQNDTYQTEVSPKGTEKIETETPIQQEPSGTTTTSTVVSSSVIPPLIRTTSESTLEDSTSNVSSRIDATTLSSSSSTYHISEETTMKSIQQEITKPIPVSSTEGVTEAKVTKTTEASVQSEPQTHKPSYPSYENTYGNVPSQHYPEEEYTDEEEPTVFGPGTCRYGGKLYVSAQQIPREDPCDFCFCFRSDIICLQQSCPPPISGCHEEPITGFCCPRYECPVSMALILNSTSTTTTTTTTTTLPPHLAHFARNTDRVSKAGCRVQGKSYQTGENISAASGPCIDCICGGDGQMKCEPKVCTPEPMLRQMIAVAASRRR